MTRSDLCLKISLQDHGEQIRGGGTGGLVGAGVGGRRRWSGSSGREDETQVVSGAQEACRKLLTGCVPPQQGHEVQGLEG